MECVPAPAMMLGPRRKLELSDIYLRIRTFPLTAPPPRLIS